MSKIIESGAMALGGLSLFAICFLGFALMAGVPANEIAVVGALFPAPPEEETDEMGPAPTESIVEEPYRSDSESVESNSTVLSTWTLPSPFSQEELQGMTDELKTEIQMLAAQRIALDLREEHLDEREGLLDERLLALASLQRHLEVKETELGQRAQEVERDEELADLDRQRELQAVAKLIETKKDKPNDAMPYLLGYSPGEVAIILVELDAGQATGILDSMQKNMRVPDIKPYIEAYAKASAAGAEQ